MNEYLSFARTGTEPHRSYYIPFAKEDVPKKKYGIIDRESSSRFFSLDGVWQIRAHDYPDDFSLNEEMEATIPVPSCVQMHGYDYLQYVNASYPFPVLFPHIPKKNPSFHYRRTFSLAKRAGERYYLSFEGVDSFFYLFINGIAKGHSQISHATSEFDVTDALQNGENTIDVLVLKWCAGSYMEDQDKLRFTGIFRSVYLLCRPEEHLTDYFIRTSLAGDDGILTLYNESPCPLTVTLGKEKKTVKAKGHVCFTVKRVRKWSAEQPSLYPLTLAANGEVIYEQVGFREMQIDGCVFKINGVHKKLKGVNRHDFHPKTGATVSLADMVKDLRLMKSLNVNAVRTSHYPNRPEFYQLCDRLGIYVIDEADIECHGANCETGEFDRAGWSRFAEDPACEASITDRLIALVERDKNRPSVVIWSLGNEAGFGKSFYPGARYIRRRDPSRPLHYESNNHTPKKAYHTTKLLDMLSMMYPSTETIQKEVLDNPKENRPFLLCEYTHAMGNSSGDLADYWKQIYANEQCMGAFVWEWADHAIRGKRGYLYGGDFGEDQHDGNFCVDGLLTTDRKLKSAALEMKAVYGGKTEPDTPHAAIPAQKGSAKTVSVLLDENTGLLAQIYADGKPLLHAPMRFNITRYIDNERTLVQERDRFCLSHAESRLLEVTEAENGYRVRAAVAAKGRIPALTYEIDYKITGNELAITIAYEIKDYIKHLPRVGLEMQMDKAQSTFSYVGYGPQESYIDKCVGAAYGYFESRADKNYDHGYVRPQESGSHFAARYLAVKDAFSVTASTPFSFSLNPYTTAQLMKTKHDFELPKNDFVCLCLDLAMRGVGSYSCGPELDKKYEIPRRGKNTFRFVF